SSIASSRMESSMPGSSRCWKESKSREDLDALRHEPHSSFPIFPRTQNPGTLPSTMKVHDAIEPFLNFGELERMYAKETMAKFRECFHSWIIPHFGEHDLAAVSRMDILAFRRTLADRGLSIARQYSLLVVLKLFLRFCRTVLRVDALDPAEIPLP